MLTLDRGKTYMVSFNKSIEELKQLFDSLSKRADVRIRRRPKNAGVAVYIVPKSKLCVSEMGMHWKALENDFVSSTKAPYMNLYIGRTLVPFTSIKIDNSHTNSYVRARLVGVVLDILTESRHEGTACFYSGNRYIGEHRHEILINGVPRFRFKYIKEMEDFFKWFVIPPLTFEVTAREIVSKKKIKLSYVEGRYEITNKIEFKR